MIKAVIFDLDGVLVSTDMLHYEAWKKLAEQLEIHNFTIDDNVRQRGVSRMASLEVLLEKSSKSYTEDEKAKLAEIKNKIYVESLSRLSENDVLSGAKEVINDVWRQFDEPAMFDHHILPDEYKQNVEKMILSVKDKAKGILLLSPYYMEPNPEDKMRARMDEYVAVCERLAKQYSCIFVDFQKMYVDYLQYQHSCYISWDRVHPNEIGAMLMAKTVLDACKFDFYHKERR